MTRRRRWLVVPWLSVVLVALLSAGAAALGAVSAPTGSGRVHQGNAVATSGSEQLPTSTATHSAASTSSCPTPLPAQPVYVNGHTCDRTPGPGIGDGPTGLCTGEEAVPPCGPGAVIGTYYPFTLPTTCTGKVWFDGRAWVSELPPPVGAKPIDVWVLLDAPTRAGWAEENHGAVGFKPDTGQALSCTEPAPTRRHVTQQVLAHHHTPSVPSYCTITTVTTTGTLTKAINIAIWRCIAAHSQTVQQTWPTTGTQMTPTQIVAQFMAEAGPPGTKPVAVYVYKTTYHGAGKIMTTGYNPTITPKAPAYMVTTHWSTGRITSTVIDAISGKGTTSCTPNCNFVQPNGTVVKTPTIHA